PKRAAHGAALRSNHRWFFVMPGGNVCRPLLCLGLWCLASRLKQFRHESRPAGLMRSADAGTVVAMKVFVEQQVVFEVRIGREFGVILQHGPLTVFAFQEQLRQST